MKSVVIIDYGVGNLRSIEKALAATGTKALVCDNEQILREADALVLPGVGAFGACMKSLSERGFDRIVVERAGAGVPLLGICVGMQMLFDESEEFGKTTGLGLLPGRVRRFQGDLVVPHVGWNQVRQRQEHQLLQNIEDQTFFYFVHSYFCTVDAPEVSVGETDYGGSFASIVSKGNISGVQFHPEKSQTAGLRLLSNFAKKLEIRI
jgi:glutamine amidotransferase